MKLYVPLLKSCTTRRPLSQIHAQLLTIGLHRDPLLSTKLLESYSKTSGITAAVKIFNNFTNPDSFMWAVMLKCYVSNLHYKEAISLYHHGLLYRQFEVSSFVLTPVLQACAGFYNMPIGRKIHGRIFKDGFDSDVIAETTLIEMYVRGGRLGDAYRVFEEMPVRDVVSLSSMISGCIRCGQADEGLNLLARVDLRGFEEDRVLVLTVADACADMGLLKEAKSVHCRIIRKRSEPDEVMENSLITMYSECYDLESAENIFGMTSMKTVVSWTAMISAYNRMSCYREAIIVYNRMLESNIEPNEVTLMGVVYSCTKLGLLKEGKSIHGFTLRRSIDPHLSSLGSALITMYSSFRKLETCFNVFDSIEKKTLLSWNSLMAACTQNVSPEIAIQLFVQMMNKGFLPDSFTLASVLPVCGHIAKISLGCEIHGIAIKIGTMTSTFVRNSLIDMYCKYGSIETALRVFDEINTKNTVTWNTMISGLSDCGFSENAIKLFEQMYYQGDEMDTVTYLNAIKACTNLGSLSKGRWTHHKLLVSGFKKDIHICTALTDMYAKCGDIRMARQIFDSVPDKNVVLWSSIISGYGNHGLISDAISLFMEMVDSGVRPNEVTFMAILSACCHAGLVEEGLYYFDLMREKFNIEPDLDHYVSVVNLLSRAGQINKAYEFIRSMQIEPDDMIWRALLNGCHINQRGDMVRVIQR
ncbi:uncharacterized protein A4U43_C03F20260 [Asparagus officinalis]|uniref:Pentacotripeptide-repeat region of PRORP domain-containing protein n=1 Tax=Asparagus officinalis TaxID=4686 RepID=A0A5P1FCE6_ASPOF|nr:putative pentatricopeptide repeat-containing protein At1g69350, mitochondrial [Asparagus officinalis]ONK75762.1 uncharacterized protein A4U43_C03F20260 [Asparagus officinalis]